MVTPLGNNSCATWEAMAAGTSGIGPVTLFDAEEFDCRVAGEVKDFDASHVLDRKELRRSDRFTQFAMVAAHEALAQAQYTVPEGQNRVATIIGSALAGMTSLSTEYDKMRERGPGRVSPFLLTQMLGDMASGQLSIKLGTKGVNYSIVSACASGADGIGEAGNIIRRGDADIAIAGGTEAGNTPIIFAGFVAAKALTTRNDDPARASRPFDKDRDGFVMGEGAGILILEAEEHARVRGAVILAELAGYGATSDAFHVTQPHESGEGAAAAMEMALKQAGMAPDDIDYVNAHGTSTPLNDKLETVALKRAFGDHAYDVAISSTKSMTGHLLGAGGAVEAGAAIMAMQHGTIPPTINYETADPDCDLDYVPNTARGAPLRAVMSNSLGFGGHNSSLIFRQYTEA
jgi:3-oxoacyl-[acyl-carrier-protein] synthase II